MGNDDAWVIMEESRVPTNISQILKRFCPPFNRLTLCYLVDPFNACNHGTKTGLDMRSSLSRSQEMVASNKLHKKESTNLPTGNVGAHWDMRETTTHNKERMNSF